jgi:hypothetical protein
MNADELKLLSIEAAEDIQRCIKGLSYSSKKVDKLVESINSNSWRADYQYFLSSAYELAGYTGDFNQENLEGITDKLSSFNYQRKEDLERLLNFCVKMSDVTAEYDSLINSHQTGCFS